MEIGQKYSRNRNIVGIEIVYNHNLIVGFISDKN